MYIINLPRNINADTTPSFFKELESNSLTKDVSINLNSVQFSTPTSMLIIGSKLRKWRAVRNENKLRTALKPIKDSEAMGYLGHLGFLDFIGSKKDFGKKMGEANGSATYVPITNIKRPQFSTLDNWYSSIISSVRGLANVLAGTKEDTEEHRFYLYTLREIVRNVFEHSQVDECFICGQRWSNGKVEIAIADEGIGISTSLNRSHSVDNEEDAIKLAIKPGVSATNNIADIENTFDNSGYGLYVLSEVVANFGCFTLGSNSARLINRAGNTSIDKFTFNGTFIGIEIDKAPKQFSEMLKDIIASGEQEAKNYGRVSSASKMSKLL
ncbi:ATP-binding protein [Moritella viscosa]|uniref:ATP-binding region, ATPase-like protein n=1 Tax=Moritella viscosa TaxID=80854 RepID=A0A1L0F9C4_9GAMM|nr:ATP-binding protein [Moritella viscosa]SGZ19505.1 ATP-binding region, ATPase-like protein [Moritella viscosa]SHO15258.1 ATP-binding region, ATPase-like protein [Moritella viscosa]SHO15451.1 ATP-binding region, ATPase-like protein [Moritella viscosa]SHO18193.1 ATP-binding region, ATPase-like protein [Moritella viscosa]SHO19231.1 ATP-binding region, ATPase-like protein [Moritella viscosa]